MEPIKDPENYAPAEARPIDRLRYLLSCVVTNGRYPEPSFASDESAIRTKCAVVVAQATEALEAARRVAADFDALVKERDEARRRASLYSDVCRIVGRDPATDRAVDDVDEVWRLIAENDTGGEDRPADESVLRIVARAERAERDIADLRERLFNEREQARGDRVVASLAAHDRADKAEALLREARGGIAVHYGPNECGRLLARIDALLRDDNPATDPSATSTKNLVARTAGEAAPTTQKEP